jgi:uncharacterized protein
MSQPPLMPKATAVWLVENTALTFQQIADFCQLHELEVKGIADGDVAQGIKGLDPIAGGQLAREELEKAETDKSYRMKILESKVALPTTKSKKGPRYTPVSRRQDRPDAIAWLLRYHPELADAQIMKLVGTTKSTIQSIRDRSHWNAQNIKPVDPVTLGLCTQLELDLAVQRAARKLRKGEPEPQARGATLLPASETVPKPETPPPAAPPSSQRESEKQYDPDSVFAKLKGVKLDQDSD